MSINDLLELMSRVESHIWNKSNSAFYKSIKETADKVKKEYKIYFTYILDNNQPPRNEIKSHFYMLMKNKSNK